MNTNSFTFTYRHFPWTPRAEKQDRIIARFSHRTGYYKLQFAEDTIPKTLHFNWTRNFVPFKRKCKREKNNSRRKEERKPMSIRLLGLVLHSYGGKLVSTRKLEHYCISPFAITAWVNETGGKKRLVPVIAIRRIGWRLEVETSVAESTTEEAEGCLCFWKIFSFHFPWNFLVSIWNPWTWKDFKSEQTSTAREQGRDCGRRRWLTWRREIAAEREIEGEERISGGGGVPASGREGAIGGVLRRRREGKELGG